MLAKEHFQAGQLKEAVARATEEVKANPGDLGRRAFLGELLCFTGDLERADKQLDALGQLAPQKAVGISLLRHLIRAEQHRRDFYTQGRLPEFLHQPTEELRLRLKASIHLREGDLEKAAELLDEAESKRVSIRGSCNGEVIDDLRDLDDLTASFLEVLTTNGKYYWIPLERVIQIEFQPPEETHDLLWRRAHLEVQDGPTGEVYLPVLYFGSHSSGDELIRLGRATSWKEGEGTPAQGLGQRTYLVGDRDLGILELQSFERVEKSGA